MRNGAFLSTRPAQSIHRIIRKRDESRKYVTNDPMTSITKQSVARPSAPSSSSSYRPPLPSKANHDNPSESSESTEQECALELIRRKRQAAAVPRKMYGEGGQEVEVVQNKARNNYFLTLSKKIC